MFEWNIGHKHIYSDKLYLPLPPPYTIIYVVETHVVYFYDTFKYILF